MTHAALRDAAYRGNMALAASGLVMGTFGNLSAANDGVCAIKPSGVPYEELTPERIVLVDLATGRPLDPGVRPSSDTPTHVELYRAFGCGAIVHTHSEFATLFAQARLPIRCMGTTHADHFRGDVPVTRPMRREEVEGEYEKNTGLVIVEAFAALSPAEVPAVLVANHGPFVWGRGIDEALENAAVLEYVARLEWRLRTMAADADRPAPFLIDRHFLRKHGPKAYYGQK